MASLSIRVRGLSTAAIQCRSCIANIAFNNCRPRLLEKIHDPVLRPEKCFYPLVDRVHSSPSARRPCIFFKVSPAPTVPRTSDTRPVPDPCQNENVLPPPTRTTWPRGLKPVDRTSLIQTRSGKWMWHYIPLIFCVMYTPIFYLSCIIIYQCENNFDYTSFLCGSICYTEVKWLLTFDWITNVLIPLLTIPLASISLLLRVVVQAKKMRRSVNWRSTRKMTIQLMMISLLYLIFSAPLAIIYLIRTYFVSNLMDEFTYYFLYYAAYVIQLLIPMVCFMCLPEMWPKRDRLGVAPTAQRAQ